jgi:hypothetical protein
MMIEYGISRMTPLGLAWFAGLLSKMGELSDALRFAKLAKTLGDRIGCREIAGNGSALTFASQDYFSALWCSRLLGFFIILTGHLIFVTSEVLYFHEPMQSVNEYRVRGQDAAMASGDVHFVCMLKLM